MNILHGWNNIKYQLKQIWVLKIMKFREQMIKIQQHMKHFYMKIQQLKQHNTLFMVGLNIMVIYKILMHKQLLDLQIMK